MTIQRWFGDEASANIGPVIDEQPDIADDFGTAALPGTPTYHYVNETGESEEYVQQAFANGRTLDGRPIRDEIASALDTWQRGMNSPSIAGGSLFFRSRYTLTSNVFDQMYQCMDAVEYDEVLGSVCDATEGLAFSRATFEMVDQDQEDIWNQIAEEIDLDTRLREMWRELYKVSQVYVAVDWQQRIYKVRTKQVPLTNLDEEVPVSQPGAEDLHPSGVPNPGPKKRARRKQFAITVPAGLTIIDPTKVLPVGQLMFGKERFAYIASHEENDAFMKVFSGEGIDPMVLKMFDGPYTGTSKEMSYLTEQHKGPSNKAYLWLFKKDAIFRHTLSRSQYERFAALRLKSALPILEMKAHLRASDRSALIGSTNFIVVLKRGSDKFPARAGEVEQLREQARVVARMPILVGDHRLSVEIITPKTDFVLDPARYNLLDERLIMRGLHTFRFGGKSAGQSDSAPNTDEQVARGIESRRYELARTIQDKLIRETIKKNEAVLTEVPALSFHPKRVVISLDADIMKLVLQLRDRGDISRETELEEFNYDQEVEYVRRKREKGIDGTFQSSVPHSSPDSNPFTTGNAGGRPDGGGGAGNDSTPASGGFAPTTPQN
jgi:hypothetical protein